MSEGLQEALTVLIYALIAYLSFPILVVIAIVGLFFCAAVLLTFLEWNDRRKRKIGNKNLMYFVVDIWKRIVVRSFP